MTPKAASSTKPTIIIPAYNEARVISETLAALYSTDGLNTYQILVVCNGCTDNTESIVKNKFPDVFCHALTQPSKSLAIRYAESLNPGFPRIYLDADVALSEQGAMQLIGLSDKQAQIDLLIPSSKTIVDHSSGYVKRFYRFWYNTLHVRQSGYGAGTYVLNAPARARFELWPELIADDAFVRSRFTTKETRITTSVEVVVKAPRTLWSLIKVKTRSKFGNIELKAYLDSHSLGHSVDTRSPSLQANQKTVTQGKSTQHYVDGFIYFIVNTIALCWAKWQFMQGNNQWFRDNSNR